MDEERMKESPSPHFQSERSVFFSLFASALKGCDAIIWCATRFFDTLETDWLEQLKPLLGIAPAPKQSIDAVGVPLIAMSMLKNQQDAAGRTKKTQTPRFQTNYPRWSC
jgi:hypothetical protein